MVGTAQPEAAATVVKIEESKAEVPMEKAVPAEVSVVIDVPAEAPVAVAIPVEEEVKLQEEVGTNGEAPLVINETVFVQGIYQCILYV